MEGCRGWVSWVDAVEMCRGMMSWRDVVGC